jgi:hypothetical protein
MYVHPIECFEDVPTVEIMIHNAVRDQTPTKRLVFLPVDCLLPHDLILLVRQSSIDVHHQNPLPKRLCPWRVRRKFVHCARNIIVVGCYGVSHGGKEVVNVLA